MAGPRKILVIQFKYLGDAVMLVPSLRALRGQYPGCALHALVPAEVSPLLRHLPWLTRVWPMPRRHGRAAFGESWPVIRALRAERFDRSVEFSGNDRSAILSLLCGARRRLGVVQDGGFWGRRFCFTERIGVAPADQHEASRLLNVLSAWNIPPPPVLEGQIHADPALAGRAAGILPGHPILCHLSSSQPRKEWPLRHWVALYTLAVAARLPLVFGTGLGEREQLLMEQFKRLAPAAPTLPPVPDLTLYLAVLSRARAFVSGDTGPLHVAAGLGVPTLALFGPTSPVRWRPLGQRHCVLSAEACGCPLNTPVCLHSDPCLATIPPSLVLQHLQVFLEQKDCLRRQPEENILVTART